MRRFDREQLKLNIETSPLFGLNREDEPTLYKREANKMVEYVFSYMLAVNDEVNSQYGMEIANLVVRCIHYYSTEKGSFLQYFLSSWRVEYERIKKKEAFEMQRCGIHIADEDKRKINKIIKYAKVNGKDFTSMEFANKVANALGINVRDVQNLIQMVEMKVVSDESTNNDGESFSLFDLVSSQEKSVEERLMEEADAIMFLKRINDVFIARQNRQKPLLSKLITSKIIQDLSSSKTLLKMAKSLDFIDVSIVEQFFSLKRVPTAREISQEFGLSEQSVSRTFKIFIELLK